MRTAWVARGALLLGLVLPAAMGESDIKAPMTAVEPEHNDVKIKQPALDKKIPTSPLPSDVVKPQDMSIEHNTVEEVEAVCRATLKGWMVADGGPPTLQITPQSSGSNSALWRVDAQPTTWCVGGGLCSVLVRRYGDDSTLLVDRERESGLLQALSQQDGSFKASTKVIGSFANGRVEEWLDGWDTLTVDQMRNPSVSNAIARHVARLHSVAPKGVKGISDKEAMLWRQMTTWLKTVSEVSFDDKEKSAALGQVKLRKVHKDALQLQKNWEYLTTVSSEPSQLVFSHNDLQLGKLKINTQVAEGNADWPQLTTVGFEYSNYNMRAFDIAHHFNAWAGHECDWGALPSEASQQAFIRAYLGKFGGWPAEAEALHKEIKLLQLASNLYSGLWGVLQAKYGSANETTDEIYWLQYAEKHVARFYAQKEGVYMDAGVEERPVLGKTDSVGDTKSVGKDDAKEGGKRDAMIGKIDHGVGHDL